MTKEKDRLDVEVVDVVCRVVDLVTGIIWCTVDQVVGGWPSRKQSTWQYSVVLVLT